MSEHFLETETQTEEEGLKQVLCVTRQELGVGVSPVQVSANIILVLCKASVILSEAEPCSHLEGKRKRPTEKGENSSERWT